MIHPSYVELMEKVNENVEVGEEPVVNSRYTIVAATSKRARQIIDGAEPLINYKPGNINGQAICLTICFVTGAGRGAGR